MGLGGDPDDLFGGMTLNTPSAAPPAPPVPVAPAVGMPSSTSLPPPIPAADNGEDSLLFGGSSNTAATPSGPGLVSGLADEPLKPQFIATPEFGAKWGTLGGESIHSAPCSVIHSLAALRGAMEGSGFFAHVETIEDTSEAIFAASLLVDNSDVLVHMKMNPGDVGITVKAVTKPQSSTAIQALLAAVSF